MMDRTYIRVQFILGSKFGFGPILYAIYFKLLLISAIHFRGFYLGRFGNRSQRQICPIKAKYFKISWKTKNPTVVSDARKRS